jgi:hypothetical protein
MEELRMKMHWDCEEECQRRLVREREVLSEEMESQLNQMQEENEKLISKLELVMKELQGEKILTLI